MTQRDLLKQFAELPAEAQRQVAELIASLRQRYQRSGGAKANAENGLMQEPFIGMWSDRDDLADSEDWVRRTRRQEWGRAG